ncbi:MAG: thiamine-phosphate kinase [Alphaproteobacteria bacterium]|nr:thiamine-phosphate kinase [Alphaproteobacteria bacterium]
MHEFEIIADYFVALTMGREECAELQDDAAVLKIPKGYEVVVSSDTLNAGTHFMKDEAPENIARKALRVSLSDLAACGAEPLSYQLNIAYPQRPQAEWLKAFTGALLADQKEFGVFCSGGDTSSIHGALSVSITVLGLVPEGKAVRRNGAKDGDAVILTGAIGDASLGLQALWKGQEKAYPKAVGRHRVPEPRIKGAALVCEHARAAVDISDGFLADLGHVCKVSGVGAEVHLGANGLAFSAEVTTALDTGFLTMEEALSGGDDYELVLAVPEEQVKKVLAGFKKLGFSPQVAGRFSSKISGVQVFNAEDEELPLKAVGWQHF